MRCSRSASRATRSRLRRNCGSCGGSSWSRATRPLAELVDHAAVAEDAVHLPVGRDRAEVDDLDVSLRRDLLELLRVPASTCAISVAAVRARSVLRRGVGGLGRAWRCQRDSRWPVAVDRRRRPPRRACAGGSPRRASRRRGDRACRRPPRRRRRPARPRRRRRARRDAGDVAPLSTVRPSCFAVGARDVDGRHAEERGLLALPQLVR